MVSEKNPDTKEKKSSKKKKKSGNTVFILVIVILAAICLFLWKFGFGFGTGSSGSENGSGTVNSSQTETVSDVTDTAPIENTETTAEANEDTDNYTVEVIVSDDKISVNGEEMSDIAELKDHLLSIHRSDGDEGGETKYTLIDSRALKSAYDGAKSVLDELGYEYSEQTAEE